tara:strand:+ start:317 stop:568 length:252 start_codon:yes stop_codon:yes gene_type:complete
MSNHKTYLEDPLDPQFYYDPNESVENNLERYGRMLKTARELYRRYYGEDNTYPTSEEISELFYSQLDRFPRRKNETKYPYQTS